MQMFFSARCVFMLFALIACAMVARSAGAEAWIDVNRPLLSYEDPHEQSRAWQTCSAAFEIAAMVAEHGEGSLVQARAWSDRANGAALAAGMVFMLELIHSRDGLDEDMLVRKFNGTWAVAKLAIEAADSMTVQYLAQLELAPEDTMVSALTTARFCMTQLESQQTYIDLWRELLASGLLGSE